MSNKKTKERDPHKFYPPKWVLVSGFLATYGLAAVICFAMNPHTFDEWILTGITIFLAVFGLDMLHERLVVRPIYKEWLRQHVLEYHKDELDDAMNKR